MVFLLSIFTIKCIMTNMAVLLPVAGGKGGVGKSILSLNLAVTLANLGKRVILVDLDLGGANLHTLLGLKNNQAGLGNFISRLESDFANLLQTTDIPNLQFIAGDCLYPGTSNMDFFTKKKIIKALGQLDADFIILDLSAGSAHNIVDFFITSTSGIIVTTPEFTSILNAYSFLKATVFRFCYRQFPAKSPERQVLQNSVLQRLEGKEYSFGQILSVISKSFPESGARVFSNLMTLRPRVIMNMGKSDQDSLMGERLKALAQNKLSVSMDFIGFVPYDDRVSLSVARRQPLAVIDPRSPFCSVLEPIAHRIIMQASSEPKLEDAPEALEDIVKHFYQSKA